jgi:hypothetical protein
VQYGADWPEVGRDALDPPPSQVDGGWLWLPRRRPALGVHATAAPTLMFVLLGAALGPHGAGILSGAVLANLEAVIWVALAVIGVFIGLGLGATVSGSARGVLVSGVLSAVITTLTVTGGLYLLIGRWGIRLPADVLAASLLIGICASVSAAVQTSSGASEEIRRAAHLADLDDIPLVVFGVVLVAALAGGSVLLRLLLTTGAGAAIGVAGWLLFERADTAERGVFVTGAVLLLAGIGAYLGTSPLLSGCIAALVWVHAPGKADRITASDLRTLQHPLVAMLLIVAGATIEWTIVVLWVTGCIVVLRFAGKLLASIGAARIVQVSPALLATVLLQPGIMGVALALNARQVLGPDYTWIVSAVTASAMASEVLAAFLPRDYEDAA